MTKKQMRRKIKALEQERDKYFHQWDERCGQVRQLIESEQEAVQKWRRAKEESYVWKEKYFYMLESNIALAEKLANKEVTADGDKKD